MELVYYKVRRVDKNLLGDEVTEETRYKLVSLEDRFEPYLSSLMAEVTRDRLVLLDYGVAKITHSVNPDIFKHEGSGMVVDASYGMFGIKLFRSNEAMADRRYNFFAVDHPF